MEKGGLYFLSSVLCCCDDIDRLCRCHNAYSLKLFEHEQIRIRRHCLLHAASHEINERRHDVVADRQDVNLLRRVGRGLSGKRRGGTTTAVIRPVSNDSNALMSADYSRDSAVASVSP